MGGEFSQQKIKVVRGTPRQLSSNGRLSKFTYLMMNFPFECNYRCPKCFGSEGSKQAASGEMSLDDRVRLIKEAKDLGGKAVVFAGEGEPSLHRGIRTMVSEVNSLGMVPIVYSNGSVLTGDLVDFYIRMGTTLVISLDSLKAETYGTLTGNKGDLRAVLSKIAYLRKRYGEVIEEDDEHRIVRLAINVTINGLNEKEVQVIRDFCEDDIYFICNPLDKSGNAVKNWDRLVGDEESYKRHIHLARELSESGGPLTLSGGTCGYSRWGVGVGPYGDYMTCAYTNRTNGLLGNVRDTDLKDAFEYKHEMESAYYGIHGAAPCLIRSSGFDSHLRELKEKTVIRES